MSEIRQKNTITRPIELWIDEEDVEIRKAAREKLWKWQTENVNMHNSIASHLYMQLKSNELLYYNPEFKESNPDMFQQGKGWSPGNRTYRLISETYAKTLPSDIISNINNRLIGTFNKEKKNYLRNERSLRSYKKNCPIPFSAKMITNITISEDKKNYHFSLFGKKHGIKFKTRFGRDTSNNKEYFESCLNEDGILFSGTFDELPLGACKLCDSSFRIDGAKIFLLAVFQFESTKNNLKEENIMEAHLSVTVPIALRFKSKTLNIGTRQDFLHRRLAIQGSLRAQQINSRFGRGGKGRKKKLKNITRFEDKEKNFVTSKQHAYSKKLVDLCLQNKCGQLVLKYTHELTPPEDLSKFEKAKWEEENQPILRNWTYYGMTEKLTYKCKKVGIKLTIEKKEAKAS